MQRGASAGLPYPALHTLVRLLLGTEAVTLCHGCPPQAMQADSIAVDCLFVCTSIHRHMVCIFTQRILVHIPCQDKMESEKPW